eukprot:12961963-Heterocapsa_arctica.AAC.1
MAKGTAGVVGKGKAKAKSTAAIDGKGKANAKGKGKGKPVIDDDPEDGIFSEHTDAEDGDED